MLLGEWGASNSLGRSLQHNDVDVVGRGPGHGVPLQRVIDFVEDLQRIGSVVTLQQGPEPVLAEEDVRGIHGIGESIGVDDQRLARFQPVVIAGGAVNHADAKHSGVRRQHPRARGADDDRRGVADPGIPDQPRFLISNQVESRTEVAFGKILLGGDVQAGQHLARLEHRE